VARISVLGLGYVGTVTATCLANAGHEIVGVDTNPDKVAQINAGTPPIVEPGLPDLLAGMVAAGRLRATRSCAEAVQRTDLALVCVGTPGRAGGQLGVQAVESVGSEIGTALRGRRSPFTVVLRSTVLPGTTEHVLLPALRAGAAGEPGAPLRVAVNPEFMREGSSLADFARPPMTLVGCGEPETAALLRSVYASVDALFVETTTRTAEMAKYVSNAFHALKVSFANEIGDLSAALGVDAAQVMRVFRMDRKLNLSEAYLRPGFAFGGSCLPKDLRALLRAGRVADLSLPLLEAVLPSNERQIRRAVEAVLETRRRRVGVLGLSFKPGTDDLRESPMVTLVETLIGKGCDLRIFDRSVSIARLVGANRRYIEEEIPHIASLMCDDLESLLRHAEVLILGADGEEAQAALAAAGPGHIVVDLARGGFRTMVPRQEAGVTA
jgi:GDP-mannose 6-dehydrogenase